MNSLAMADQGVTLMALLAIVLAVVSIIMAAFSVWASLTFYKLTTESVEENKKAAELLKNSANRMENLFEKFYLNMFEHAAHDHRARKSALRNEELLSSDVDDLGEQAHSTIADTIISLIQRQNPLTLNRLFTHPSLKRFHVSEVEHEIKMLADEHLISIFGPLNRPDTVVIPFSQDVKQGREEETVETEK